MAISGHWYTLAAQGQWSGTPVNWTSDTILCALVSSSYSPSQDTDQFWVTPQANEITGTGYNAGGQQLTGVSVGGVTATHEIPLLASATTWTNATFTARYAVIYKSTGNASTSPLMGWVDFGSNQSVVAGTFELAWDTTNGVLAATAA